MTFFLLLWMSLAVLAGTNIDYLFLELILIMANGHWHTGAPPSNRLPPALYSAKTVVQFKKLYSLL